MTVLQGKWTMLSPYSNNYNSNTYNNSTNNDDE